MPQSLPKGLFKRGGSYAVRYSVPIAYRDAVGRKEIVKSLATGDLCEALRLREPTLEAIEAGLIQVLATPTNNGRPNAEPSTIRATADQWLHESDGISRATKQRYRSILEAFGVFAGNCDVTKIDRQMALQFMNQLGQEVSRKTGKPYSRRSLKAYQTCLASFWNVLDHKGLVDPNQRNPFSSLLRKMPGKKVPEDTRKRNLRPVRRQEAEQLLAAINAAPQLTYRWEMHVIANLLWVTACRLEEIASLQLTSIKDGGDHHVLHIQRAKTEAGTRDVYVVGQAERELLQQAVIRARSEKPLSPENDGMLFPRLRRGGYDRKASHYLGKAFGRVRCRLQVFENDGATWDMHSFRRTGISALVNAGVPKGERNLAVGHSNKDDIGLHVYAKNGDTSSIQLNTFQRLYEALDGGLRTCWTRNL